ncbi:MAG: SprB repeat-containing protein [Saprospiraceae bacterium]|nr:SprB repeat-containing protein [Candidatus Defluviibacterium haderslevense]
MNKHFKLAYFILLANIQLSYAKISISFVTNINAGEINTGKVKFTVSNCTPYILILHAKTSGWNRTYDSIYTSLLIEGMPPDIYEVEAYTVDRCRADLTFEIKNCNHISAKVDHNYVCNGNPATVKIIPSGGQEPYQYKWYNNSGVRIDSNPIGGNTRMLDIGKYYIVIIDKIGCEFRLSFNIKGFNIKATARGDYYCFNQNKVIIKVEHSLSREYLYIWSDDFQSQGYESHIRKVNNAQNYTITIKDLLTSCEYVIPKIDPFPIPDSNQKISIIHSLHHDVNNNGQGQITILMADLPSRENLYVDVFKNSTLIQNNQPLNRRLYTIADLTSGEYKLDIKDSKTCLINSINQSIYTCPDTSVKYKVTTDFQLPPSQPNSYFKLNITETNIGPLTYSWFLNDYIRLYTSKPEINTDQLSKFNLTDDFRKFYVTTYSPCGEERLSEWLNPCFYSENKKPVKYDQLDLPFGRFDKLSVGDEVNYKSNGTINLDINLTQRFMVGKQGLDKFNKQIKEIRWADQEPIQLTGSGNNIHITRNIDKAKIYSLVFVDGNGCISVEHY